MGTALVGKPWKTMENPKKTGDVGDVELIKVDNGC
jgi:hypothetical protein